MKKSTTFFLLVIYLMSGCSYDDSFDSASSSDSVSDQNINNESGLITAAEWNDLDNWQFWTDLINGDEFSDQTNIWSFHNINRVSILLTSNSQPQVDATVQLIRNGEIIWQSKTYNFGKAELWINLFNQSQAVNISEFSLNINDQPLDKELKLYQDGVNEIEINNSQNFSNRVELSFIVDATGSMADELEFLKSDLANVIQRVEQNNSSLQIYTSSVFYRDEGDDYLVRNSDFSDDLNSTLNFISNQSADGGGDFPEAVHTGLEIGIQELKWSSSAKSRIAFLLLDAPPHNESQVVSELQNSIKIASEKGIKVIPITASGIDKSTEFLMRYFSITTNSTYVFITNDSGIGNDHLEASVGEHEIEFLNDLMVRLIEKYTN